MTSPTRSLLLLSLTAGLLQVLAGVAMYLAGVYFAPWSMGVTGFLLLLAVLAGVARHRGQALGGTMTLAQAFGAGVSIALATGVLYALYNVVTIRFVYDDFLGQVAHLNGQAATLPGIALGNLIRLTVLGTVIAAVTAPLQRR